MTPLNLFYSYAHEDEPLRDELQGHLGILQRRGVIDAWYDRDIPPASEWNREIDRHLRSADIVLLLVSADFIASDYIWGRELEVALERQASGDAQVIPILIRAVDIDDAPFSHLQGLPTDLRPVTSWPNRDEAWTDVAKGVRRAVKQIQAQRASDEQPPATTPSPPQPTPKASDPFDRQGHGLPPRTVANRGDGEGDDMAGNAYLVRPPAEAEPRFDGDALLQRVVSGYHGQILEAARARGTEIANSGALDQQAATLIDVHQQRRVLWVDDAPANNRFEAAALSHLQIEVVQALDTESALARLRAARDDASDDAFDLVISDWSRVPSASPDEAEGLRLLRRMREEGFATPLIFYHGEFQPTRRARRREEAARGGALGEAVQPDELVQLVVRALASG